MNNKKFILGLALGALISLFVLQRCDDTAVQTDSLTEQLLQDSIRHYLDENGGLVARNITLLAEKDELLALQTAHTDLIAALQRTVQEQGKRLKGATAVATKTDMQLPFDLFFQKNAADTVRDTLTVFADPYAQVQIVRDTVALAMRDTLTFWHRYEPQGFLKRKKLFVHARNKNPYIRIEGLKSYEVPKRKCWLLRLFRKG